MLRDSSDELAFWRLLKSRCRVHGGPDQAADPRPLLARMLAPPIELAACGQVVVQPRDLINENGFPMHHKRAWRLLEKWSDRGLYEYGTVIDMGWVTPLGRTTDDPRHPPTQLEIASGQ